MDTLIEYMYVKLMISSTFNWSVLTSQGDDNMVELIYDRA